MIIVLIIMIVILLMIIIKLTLGESYAYPYWEYNNGIYDV